MTRGRHAPLAWVLTAVFLAFNGHAVSSEPVVAETRWESVEPATTEGLYALQRLDWEHWGLELFLWDVSDVQGRAQFRFLLQLRPDTDRAWTSVGYPRYRTEAGRWHDAVTRGVMSRSRVVEASLDRSDHTFFSVVVPLGATELSVPVGGHTVRLEAGAWIDTLSEGEPARQVSVSAPPPVTPAAAAPGRPVSLAARLRWPGDKPFDDGALDAGERGELLVDVYNDGERTARGVSLRITPAIGGVTSPDVVPVPDIDPGRVATVSVPFEAGFDVEDVSVALTIETVEPYGHDAAPISFELTTRAAEPSALVLTDDFAVEGADLPLPRDSIVTIRLRVRNVGYGEARDVVAAIKPGDGVFPAHDSEERFELGEIGPGAVREITYRCYANQRAERLALHVDLSDEHTRSAPAASVLTLPLESSGTVPRIVRVTPDPRSATPAMSPPPPPLTSDVDRFVPEGVAPRPTALAVVLGIESYIDAPPATYAAQDARTAARYFENALGIPPERVELLLDEEVTLAQMNRVFGRDGWLARRVHEDTEVFVFFAGHGVADGEAFDPFLVPADGDLDYIRQTGFSLDRIVERLAALDAGSVTLFIDACFSGLTREGDTLLAGTRKLVIVPAYRSLAGVSVYSAARGSQVAHSLDDQGHGLFSYYVFKGLAGGADLDGDHRVQAGELGVFLEDEIPRAAARLDREQAPAIFLDDGNRVLVSLP